MALYFYKGYSRCLSVLQKAQHWKDYFHLFASYVNYIGTTHLFWKRMSGSIWLLPDILKFDLHVKLPKSGGLIFMWNFTFIYNTGGKTSSLIKISFYVILFFLIRFPKKFIEGWIPPPSFYRVIALDLKLDMHVPEKFVSWNTFGKTYNELFLFISLIRINDKSINI